MGSVKQEGKRMKASLISVSVDGRSRRTFWKLSQVIGVGGAGGGTYDHVVTQSRDSEDGRPVDVRVFLSTGEQKTRKCALVTIAQTHAEAMKKFLEWCKR